MLLVPSLWQEPFGLVIAEAMARGLPVIASDVGGPAEIITHGVDGLLVSPGDEQALASAITYLLDDTNECKRLSVAALTTVRGHFTIDGNVKSVEQHLLRAIRGEPVNTVLVEQDRRS
jgi:glycosyltransferase involved in cell wall biosynthesis